MTEEVRQGSGVSSALQALPFYRTANEAVIAPRSYDSVNAGKRRAATENWVVPREFTLSSHVGREFFAFF
ncbi:hypothetical protein ACFQZE_02085 [Paenibacillus sp. GCM10027627]|uniref:hypothetical protein n=1 Tax=unclassified Paenibacillus TaxID=185978 RepID=UPI00363BFC99